MEYVISVWRDVHDNAVKSLGPGDWSWVLEQLGQFEANDDKYSAFLFNLTHFDAAAKKTGLIVADQVKGSLHDQRKGDNIVAITGLVIDYDNESLLQEHWTMDTVAERFKEYTYLMYSSQPIGNTPPLSKDFA